MSNTVAYAILTLSTTAVFMVVFAVVMNRLVEVKGFELIKNKGERCE